DGKITAEFYDGSQASYSVTLSKNAVVEKSSLGITIDGADLGKNTKFQTPRYGSHDSSYPWLGIKSTVRNHYNYIEIPVKQKNKQYTLQARCYNDGFAFRYHVDDSGEHLVNGEATEFSIPKNSTLWYHSQDTHYEGVYKKRDIADVNSGQISGPPLTIKLPNDNGYAAITEGALINYSGMMLKADGKRAFAAFFHDDPNGWKLNAPITSPWRLVIIAADLNGLVNSMLVPNVSPAPQKILLNDGKFADWIQPGKCTWSYLGGAKDRKMEWMGLENMKIYAKLAGQLGFEYNLIDAGWGGWKQGSKDCWQLMKEHTAYAKKFGVKTLVWKKVDSYQFPPIRDRKTRRQFFDKCVKTGIAGIKIDFLDSESKQMVDFMQQTLEDAADYKLLINFHGVNKPTGEARTWPNELTREGVMGLEYAGGDRGFHWSEHNTIIPFTRLLAGHADYTPLSFGPRKRNTTSCHQVATAVILTSPLLIFSEHPQNMLESSAVDIIRSIEPVWDETIVLPQSEIGKLAAFARRKGSKWFLAVINGPQAKTAVLNTDTKYIKPFEFNFSFLADGKYSALILKDDIDQPDKMTIETKTVTNQDSIKPQLLAAGGLVIKFTPTQK
ncbi:MAG: glycoside hydrolase family 97 catalytic domain-containing protein, partial [Planctomycetes bacterium]|nr:glycoside hydrolase family 97 catalytic domain-containing protein [Planctomycetota bacterium]